MKRVIIKEDGTENGEGIWINVYLTWESYTRLTGNLYGCTVYDTIKNQIMKLIYKEHK